MSKSLRFTAVLMLIALVGALIGMLVDSRTITGVNAWIKPAKFAISSAIFAGTMAWLFGYLTAPATTLERIGNIFSVVLILENVIIFLQAWRGTTSHFNQTTPLNLALYGIMGVAIGVLWMATIWIFVLAMRQHFEDTAWGWGLRLGLLITVIGSAVGGVMSGHGSHTIGGPDGGPGLPFVGWSTKYGDLRIAHFLGLHGLQIIPFLAFLVQRSQYATPLVFTAAGGYFAVMTLLAVQALRGLPL